MSTVNVNASRYRDVVRYHLVQRFNYAILPWAVLAFVFLIDVVVIELTPAGHTSHRWVGGLASVFVIGFVLGIQSAHRSLPFGLALGLSRRTYFLGTALLAVALAAVVGVLAVVGQAIERATDGWGINMGFFRVPYILNGPWYSTWLTSFVFLTFLYVYGMWVGLVYRRWNLIGTVAFVAAAGDGARDRGGHCHRVSRLASRWPLLHHRWRRRSDRSARGARGRAARRRICHDAPGNGLSTVVSV